MSNVTQQRKLMMQQRMVRTVRKRRTMKTTL